ncbi:MAG: hypothetical protein JXR48_16175 [Candidatus Delongbacteria bacterium]|nr:hypothetical protein [Candidatus Delongbacteria bacterium]MBN2836496.1 hypothetical protein [Candidatus Delongbacteria bacterium]
MKIEKSERGIILDYLTSKIKLTQIDGNLYTIKIVDFYDLSDIDQKKFGNFFKSFCNERKIRIFTNEARPENIFLKSLNYKIYKSKILYKKTLTEIKPISTHLIFKPITEISHEIFIETFTKSLEDYHETDGLNCLEYFNYLKSHAGNTFNEIEWKVVFHKNEPIGVLFPQVYSDNVEEGTIFYIGLIPKYRKMGFGRSIHLEGLNCLYRMGVKTYFGSTLKSNLGMQMLFKFNDCKIEAHQNFFTL